MINEHRKNKKPVTRNMDGVSVGDQINMSLSKKGHHDTEHHNKGHNYQGHTNEGHHKGHDHQNTLHKERIPQKPEHYHDKGDDHGCGCC